MALAPEPGASPPEGDDGLSREALDRAMSEVPKGALALAGLTVGLLMVAYFLIYFLVFLPRGTVG
jgi:hypothetical protein